MTIPPVCRLKVGSYEPKAGGGMTLTELLMVLTLLGLILIPSAVIFKKETKDKKEHGYVVTTRIYPTVP